MGAGQAWAHFQHRRGPGKRNRRLGCDRRWPCSLLFAGAGRCGPCCLPATLRPKRHGLQLPAAPCPLTLGLLPRWPACQPCPPPRLRPLGKRAAAQQVGSVVVGGGGAGQPNGLAVLLYALRLSAAWCLVCCQACCHATSQPPCAPTSEDHQPQGTSGDSASQLRCVTHDLPATPALEHDAG